MKRRHLFNSATIHFGSAIAPQITTTKANLLRKIRWCVAIDWLRSPNIFFDRASWIGDRLFAITNF